MTLDISVDPRLSQQANAFDVLTGRQTAASQIAAATTAEISASADIAALPKIIIDRQTYVLASQVANKTKKKKSSWIYNHGYALRLVIDDTVITGVYWLCRRCSYRSKPVIFAANATSSSAHHLRSYVSFNHYMNLSNIYLYI
jgi:hypothetical protein